MSVSSTRAGAGLSFAGLALLMAVVGCSSSDTASSATSTSAGSSTTTGASSSSAAPTSTDAAEAGPTTLTIDGQPTNAAGTVVCSTTDGKFSIAVGDLGTGFIVGLEPDGSVVHNIGLPIMDNGVVLSYTEGVPGNEATASKDGNTYTITGTATGTDNANAQVSKPFDIEVTCP